MFKFKYRLFSFVLVVSWLAACNTPVAQETVPVLRLPTVIPSPIVTATSEKDDGDVDPTPLAVEEVVQLFDSPAYGMHTSTWWRPNEMRIGFDYVADAGFGWVKQPIAWSDIEKAKDGYDWYFLDEVIVPAAEERGLKLVLRLDRSPLWAVFVKEGLSFNTPPQDSADFGDFCFNLAERYAGRIAAYQVWNEPNLNREWGNYTPDAVAYTDLLRECYEGIKSADSDAIVISAGLSPTCDNTDQATNDMQFLREMYAAGAGAYFDVLGVNAPGFNQPPAAGYDGDYSDNAEDCAAYTYRYRHVEDMRALMVEEGDGAKQIAILEMGWPSHDGMGFTDKSLDELHNSYSWFAVDNQTQAQYLVEAYQFAAENWQPWIGLITTIYVADQEWTAEQNEQWWWSIVLPDRTLRPGYEALREMEK